MEKRFAQESRAQWKWHEPREESGPIAPSFVETCFYPCGAYSRSWARLKAAFAGHDAQQIPNLGCVNSNCCEFLACLPCKHLTYSTSKRLLRI